MSPAEKVDPLLVKILAVSEIAKSRMTYGPFKLSIWYIAAIDCHVVTDRNPCTLQNAI